MFKSFSHHNLHISKRNFQTKLNSVLPLHVPFNAEKTQSFPSSVAPRYDKRYDKEMENKNLELIPYNFLLSSFDEHSLDVVMHGCLSIQRDTTWKSTSRKDRGGEWKKKKKMK